MSGAPCRGLSGAPAAGVPRTSAPGPCPRKRRCNPLDCRVRSTYLCEHGHDRADTGESARCNESRNQKGREHAAPTDGSEGIRT
jgi:hypothetical protein